MYERLDVNRVLVIAPKKVAEATWQLEARKWDNLSHLRFSTVLGAKERRLEALRQTADIYVINRENVPWLCEECANGTLKWCFDMVVFDESSSFKSASSKRFKWMKRFLPKIQRTVILTGTPAPNGLEDLWAQIYLLDRGERLGSTITGYRNRFFDYNPWRHELTAKAGAYEAVQSRIADICVSMSAKDYLTLPEMVINDVPIVLDESSDKKYEDMKRTMILDMDGEELEALSAAALTGKLLQLCSGNVYDTERNVIHIHDAKAEALTELLEALNGQNVLLFYAYQHELPVISDAAKKAGRKSVRVLQTAQDVEDWNRNKVELLIAHPASCAYGLNLQQGGNHIVWYTLSWNLEQYQQANARLHRQGQTKPTFVHRLIVEGKLDRAVAMALEDKDGVQSALLNYLKAEIEKTGGKR